MANEISGTEGSVTGAGVALEASEWDFDGDQAVIDRSNFTTGGEPANAPGQRTGAISMSGPVSRTTALAAKGVTRGSLVVFQLRVTANLMLQVVGRVSKCKWGQNKDTGSNWTVQASQYGPITIVGL